jgi:hypothetical protein
VRCRISLYGIKAPLAAQIWLSSLSYSPARFAGPARCARPNGRARAGRLRAAIGRQGAVAALPDDPCASQEVLGQDSPASEVMGQVQSVGVVIAQDAAAASQGIFGELASLLVLS